MCERRVDVEEISGGESLSPERSFKLLFVPSAVTAQRQLHVFFYSVYYYNLLSDRHSENFQTEHLKHEVITSSIMFK